MPASRAGNRRRAMVAAFWRLLVAMGFVFAGARCSDGGTAPQKKTLLIVVKGAGSVSTGAQGAACTEEAQFCTGDFADGTSVTITATRTTATQSITWGGSCTGSGTTCVVIMDLHRTVTVTFGPTSHSLIVTLAGSGTGGIISSPPAIECEDRYCATSFAIGTGVTLAAEPSPGSTFAGWTGEGCSGTGTCQLTLSDDRHVVATFTLATYPISVTKSGAGSGTVTSTPAGIDCGATCQASFGYNTTLVLTATATAGSVFAGWSGEGCSGKATCTVTATQARNVQATFLATFPISVTLAGNGGGSVTSSPAGIDCPGTCTFDFVAGQAVALTPAANSSSDFVGWTGCANVVGTTCTIAQASSVTATFNSATLATISPRMRLSWGWTASLFDDNPSYQVCSRGNFDDEHQDRTFTCAAVQARVGRQTRIYAVGSSADMGGALGKWVGCDATETFTDEYEEATWNVCVITPTTTAPRTVTLEIP